MGLESATFVSQLVSTNPVGATDLKSQGDDHLRLIKAAIKATLPNASKAFYFPVGVTKAADYTVLSTDMSKLIDVSAFGAERTMTLPTLTADDAGWLVYFAKIDSSVNAVVIEPATGTINGAASISLTAQYAVTMVWWSGSEWFAFIGLGSTIDLTGNLTVGGTLAVTGIATFSATSYLKLPSGTTAQQSAAGAAGRIRWNTTTGRLVVDDGTVLRTVFTDAEIASAAEAETGTDNTKLMTPLRVKASQNLVLLDDVDASNASNAAFDTASWFDEDWAELLITLEGVYPNTDDEQLELNVSSGGSYKTSGYLASSHGVVSPTPTVTSDHTTARILLCTAEHTVNNNTSRGWSGEVRIPFPSATARRKLIRFQGVYYTPANEMVVLHGGGFWDGGNGALDGVRFRFNTPSPSSSSNINGRFRLYGLRAA